jgi:succinate-semialdehyde dehydrogenase/glutarate-semialdehyde dehydrogenase
VLAGVPPDAGILDKEIFGPVAPTVRFSSADEVIAQANNTGYGLVSCLYSADLCRSPRAAEALEAGMIGINRGVVPDPVAPFGAVKQPGVGHEGLLEFSEMKYIAVDW